MNWTALWQIVWFSFAVAAIACTISRAQVFSFLRFWIKQKSEWLGELINCPYCTSHWLALGFVVIYRPVLFNQYWLIDLLVSWFVIVALSAIISGFIRRMNPFYADGGMFIKNFNDDGLQ